ncbi:outer membrane protein TolC [Chitinophaga terrae (ex Kim and Jung 2007)]|uniref:TolC family protein n=1 Tax=Chitinophaga terrae (ex Kim and Jung 2007) TaxID=408074 RepID=UPI00278587CE|nr:TolC family protein [Chitinophaga terrae (ex Kim and Jung 2007)]MDQ0109874.1 outer membrane protein TolC [Chitinophaga terrae (ex Kim and Jung 2007)]
MKRLKLTLILLLGIGVYNGYAQAPLTLKEALKFALQNNQQLAKTKLDEEMGKFKTQEVRSQALPQVNGNGNYTDNLQLAKSILPGDAIGKPGENIVIGFGVKYGASIGAELNQQIYNQSVFTGLKAAKAGEEYYKLATQQSTEDVIYNVTQLYYQLLITQENLKSLDSNILKLTDLVTVTKSQYDNGLAKKIDLDRIKVNLTNYQTQRVQTLNQYTMQVNNLKKIMGMPLQSAFVIPPSSLKDIESSATAVLQYDDANMEDRTELKLLRKQEELQLFQKKAYQAENYPSLSLFGRYSYSGMSNQWMFAKDPVNSTLWYGTSAIGLSLKIPIFDGFGRRSKVSQADVTLRQLKHTMEDTKLALNTQYENAKLTIRTNITAIHSQKENMELANEVYYSTQNNYRLGLASLTDLLNAETSLADAQNAYNAALLQYRLAELDIIKSKGNLRDLLN